MADTFNYKHGAAIAIPFSKSNLTTGESNTDLVLAGATTLYVAPLCGRGDIGHFGHHHHHARRDQHVRC